MNSKGSTWNKWDLHVHTPLSINQEFGGDTDTAWEKYVEKLSQLPEEIKVLGITDYLFIDGYEKLLRYKDRFPNIKLLIPNIEFRLNKFADGDKRINLHVLFDPQTVNIQDIKDQLLNCLSKGYLITTGEEWDQTPTIRSLEELGAMIKTQAPADNSVHNKTNLKVGFDNITYDIDDILKNLKKSCFKGKYLTAIGYAEWSQFRWNQSAGEKRTLVNKADFFLTSNDSEDEIEEHKKDLRSNSLRDLILQSSDAHEIEKIGATKLWIKSDITFSGLKQSINEPERVFLGDQWPNYKNSHQVITNISIKDSNNWFGNDFDLELNRNMVAIIGGRGSGKSALIEMIAAGAGIEEDAEESFLVKASKHTDSIEGAKVTLKWEDGTETSREIGKELLYEEPLIQFLPQTAVAKLCSPEGEADLIKQIELVIYNSLDESERLGASNFSQLKEIVLRNFQIDRENIEDQIRKLNKNIFELEEKINQTPQKKKRLEELENNLKKLKISLIKLPSSDKAKQDKLSYYIGIQQKLRKYLSLKKGNLQRIEDLFTRLKIYKEDAGSLEEDIKDFLEQFALDQETLEDLHIKIDTSKFDDILNKLKGEFHDEFHALFDGDNKTLLLSVIEEKDENKIDYKNYKELNEKITQITDETKSYETKILQYQKQQKEIEELNELITNLKTDIESTEKNSKPALEKSQKERESKFVEGLSLLLKEKKVLEELYKPLQETLDRGSEADKLLKFKILLDYDLDDHLQNGLDILDRNRKGNFKEDGVLKKRLEEFWTELEKSIISTDSPAGIMENFLAEFNEYENKELSIQEQIKSSYSLEDFYNWFFSIQFYSIKSSLAFNDIDLRWLSPGQKGITLLLLFLAIDKKEFRPLIIDQPEDNLDSLSIYNEIIKYFRNRKVYRQIIIVSHNPNLVVNTDAEQVIIAHYNGKGNPRLKYDSGSLEDHAIIQPNTPVEQLPDRILETVCNILEGGRKPIRERNKKYDLSPKPY